MVEEMIENEDKQTVIRYQKNTELSTNKIRIPKWFVSKNGNNFYMDVYADKIVLYPIKKAKQEG